MEILKRKKMFIKFHICILQKLIIKIKHKDVVIFSKLQYEADWDLLLNTEFIVFEVMHRNVREA